MPNDSPDWGAQTDITPLRVGELILPRNQAFALVQLVLPVTATGVVVIVGSLTQDATYSIVGDVSGAQYGPVTVPAGTRTQLMIPGPWGSEGSLNLSITVAAPESATGDVVVAQVWVMRATGVQAVWNRQQLPLWVAFAATPSVVVSQAPWPAAPPSIASVLKTADLAAGGTTAVLAGAAGKVVTVYGYSLSAAPATPGTLGTYGVTLRSDVLFSPVSAAEFQTATAVGFMGTSFAEDMDYGLRLAAGEGLQLAADAGNVGPLRLRCVVKYAQV